MFGPRPRWTASEIQSIASGSSVRAWASGPASTTSKPSALTSSPAVVFAAASSPQTNIVGLRGVERRRENDYLTEARRLGDAARPRLHARRRDQGRHLGAPGLTGAEHHLVAGGGPALAERGADGARADDPDSHLVSHMTAGLNRAARTP